MFLLLTIVGIDFLPDLNQQFVFNAKEHGQLGCSKPPFNDCAELAERLNNLKINLDNEQESNHPKLTRAIKPARKRQAKVSPSINLQPFCMQPLPPFAGSPKEPPILSTANFAPISISPPPLDELPTASPILSTVRLNPTSISPPPLDDSSKGPPILSTIKFASTNIPPPLSPPQQQLEEADQQHQDTATVKENISNCFITTPLESGQDQLASIFYVIEQMSPITAWHQLTMLNLSRQNLTNISDLSKCFPVLEYLQV